MLRACLRIAALAAVSASKGAGAAPGFQPLVRIDPGVIGAMTAMVKPESLDQKVIQLESFVTRRSDTPEGVRAGQWIAARLESYGPDSIFVHRWSRLDAPNVVAIQRGVTRPDEIVLVGGHYDSVSRETSSAPGSDDNASGTACVLECARILSGFRFERTLQFVTFSAEEFGLWGSNAYAGHLGSLGAQVVGFVNVDMIGYLEPGDRRDLDIVSRPADAWLRDAAFAAAAEYVPSLPLVDGHYPANANSDQSSFWSHGHAAISFFEDSENSSPYIHSPNDTYLQSYNDPVLATGATRTAVALLASLAMPITVAIAVQDLEGRWDASGIEIAWRLAAPEVEAVRVERAPEAAGPWAERTREPLPAAPAMHFLDPEPPDAEVAWYRLRLESAAGTQNVGPLAILRGVRPAGGVALLVRDTGRGAPVEISFSLGVPRAARLWIFDARGRPVRSFGAISSLGGMHLHLWDRRDDTGARVARGVYLVHLDADPIQVTRKLVLLHD